MNSFSHTCTHCAKIDVIPRAVAVQCPTCHARPGSPCMDMRGRNPGKVPIAKLHPARHERIRELDLNRVRPPALRSVPTATTG